MDLVAALLPKQQSAWALDRCAAWLSQNLRRPSIGSRFLFFSGDSARVRLSFRTLPPTHIRTNIEAGVEHTLARGGAAGQEERRRRRSQSVPTPTCLTHRLTCHGHLGATSWTLVVTRHHHLSTSHTLHRLCSSVSHPKARKPRFTHDASEPSLFGQKGKGSQRSRYFNPRKFTSASALSLLSFSSARMSQKDQLTNSAHPPSPFGDREDTAHGYAA